VKKARGEFIMQEKQLSVMLIFLLAFGCFTAASIIVSITPLNFISLETLAMF
jgi:hypothetical protein